MTRDLHELFTAAGSSIPVGPPPDVGDRVARTRTLRRHWVPVVAAACAVALVLAAGAGARQLATNEDPAATSPRDEGSPNIALTCASSLRAVSDGGFDVDPVASDTPLDVATRYVDLGRGERPVVTDESATGATAYVLRRDGTARLQVKIVGSDEAGWSVGGLEGCSGTSLLPATP